MRHLNSSLALLLLLSWPTSKAPAQSTPFEPRIKVAVISGHSEWEQPQDCSAARKKLTPYSELATAFQYDTKAPLAVDALSTSDDGNLTVQTIEFDAGDGLKCSGELIFPDRKGKYPGVVWLGTGDKDWESYAVEFSKLGAVSILPDRCEKRRSPMRRVHTTGYRVQTVINVRRALDIVSARGDVDSRRVALVGHSGGTIWGADALAVDKRFKAAVLAADSFDRITQRYFNGALDSIVWARRILEVKIFPCDKLKEPTARGNRASLEY
jgi:hypothetical protein